MKLTDAVFEFITTNKNTNKLVKEIKNGTKENTIKSWFELIYDASREYGKMINKTFGFYPAERNKLAKRLMNHYGL